MADAQGLGPCSRSIGSGGSTPLSGTMKITFLGTNGWYDIDMGNTICTLIDSQKFYLILDAGNGIYKIDRYIKEQKSVYLFISHLHLDHIEGLHILNKFKSLPSLGIYGRKGIKKELNKFVNDPFTVPLNKLPFPAKVFEVKEGANQKPFSFSALRIFHHGITLGYRFQIENKFIAYCTDTGKCDNTLILANNADLLIHECAFKEKPKGNIWGHSTPEEAATIAKKAQAQKLVLTHFEARIYLSLEDRQYALNKAQKIFKNTILAQDNLTINV